MRKLAILMGLLLILAVGVLPAAAITWGTLDTEHTNVGAMVIDHPDYGPYQWCSGTLIHERVFLTAGHCTEGFEDGTITVWVNFDQYALEKKGLLDVAQVITHPDYNWGPTSNPHDVGVLILEKPVKKRIKPANLPYEGFLDDLMAAGELRHGSEWAKFTLVGYGGTLEWPPPEITYDDYRQFAVSEYQALLDVWLRMSQNQATDDGGTCYGDSGGPAFWTEPDGTEILVGITSWGDMPCVASAFNYRVDIPETLDFIDDVIDSLE